MSSLLTSIVCAPKIHPGTRLPRSGPMTNSATTVPGSLWLGSLGPRTVCVRQVNGMLRCGVRRLSADVVESRFRSTDELGRRNLVDGEPKYSERPCRIHELAVVDGLSHVGVGPESVALGDVFVLTRRG